MNHECIPTKEQSPSAHRETESRQWCTTPIPLPHVKETDLLAQSQITEITSRAETMRSAHDQEILGTTVLPLLISALNSFKSPLPDSNLGMTLDKNLPSL